MSYNVFLVLLGNQNFFYFFPNFDFFWDTIKRIICFSTHSLLLVMPFDLNQKQPSKSIFQGGVESTPPYVKDVKLEPV